MSASPFDTDTLSDPSTPQKQPINCPSCGIELYPMKRLRPKPRLPTEGIALLCVAIVVAVGVFWGLGILIRSMVFIPSIILAIPLLAAALICALPIAFMAYKFPGVTTLRCRSCHWTGKFREQKLRRKSR